MEFMTILSSSLAIRLVNEIGLISLLIVLGGDVLGMGTTNVDLNLLGMYPSLSELLNKWVIGLAKIHARSPEIKDHILKAKSTP